MTDLRLYNTLTKQKEVFTPIHNGKVGMYTCGPTVYDFVHIGNWRSYVFADTIKKVLQQNGFEVRHIENITDVGHLTADDIAQGDSGEDKMVKKALAEKKSPLEIAEFYTDYFHQREVLLGIEPAHFYPKATGHISHMIKMIEALIEKGHAYVSKGAVFYDVTTFPAYGKLSGNTLENLEVGARLEAHPDKKNPWDFALWLPAPEGHLMRWNSPWSEGYPGWHIECSAMSTEYLGDVFDIHTGGEDNIFPHHEAEIAQTCGVTGKPEFARFFLHARHMLVDGQKMSKSKGNFYTLENILEKGFTPEDLRITFLGSHYRSQMNFTWESLAQGQKNKERFMTVYGRLLAAGAKENPRPVASFRLAAFMNALSDDINTPLALAEALATATEDNKYLDEGHVSDINERLADWQVIFMVFGLQYRKTENIPEEVLLLAKKRQEARMEKDFALSDTYRDQINALGYEIKDTPTGFTIIPL